MSESTEPAMTIPPPASPIPPAARPVTARSVAAETAAEQSESMHDANAAAASYGPRRVRLTVSRIDPWSAMKLGFLLSIAMGIVLIVAVALVWMVLNEMNVFTKMHGVVDDIGAQAQFGWLLEYMEFSRVISAATVIAVVDIVLLTAMITLGAFIYNFVAAMVGGLHLTLTDD